LIVSSIYANTLYFARQYDSSVAQLRKTLDMDPNFPLAHYYLGLAELQLGKNQEAIEEYQKALNLSDGQAMMRCALGHAYAVSGKRNEALKTLADLQDAPGRYVEPVDIALVQAGLGDKAKALQWLEKAYEDHSQRFSWIKVEPRFDILRGEPRFQDLLRRMGLGS
jgi:tetratricopeptide (TPR) repeat protein